MQPTEIIGFGATMFLALAALIKWKRRRDLVAARLNRGLRGYVDGTGAIVVPVPEKTPAENLIPA
jgi:hypothetical protein